MQGLKPVVSVACDRRMTDMDEGEDVELFKGAAAFKDIASAPF